MRDQLPSIFISIGEFDMTFEATSPQDYVTRLQDQERLRSQRLKLRFLRTNNESSQASTSHTTFALERNFRAIGVWAVGIISLDDSGKTRVVGKIGIDYWFLGFIVFAVVLIVINTLGSTTPTETFVIFSIALVVAYSIWFLGLFTLKHELTDYLKETNSPIQT